MKREVAKTRDGISRSVEPPPVFTKCAAHSRFPKMPRIAPISNLLIFCDTRVALGNSCDHILACGGPIRSYHGLESVHMDVARLVDASIGVFLVRFGALREVRAAKNNTNS